MNAHKGQGPQRYISFPRVNGASLGRCTESNCTPGPCCKGSAIVLGVQDKASPTPIQSPPLHSDSSPG